MILAYYKLFVAENVMISLRRQKSKLGLHWKMWKFASVFCVDTRKYIGKYIGKKSMQDDGSIMSNELILNFMSYKITVI